MQDCLKQFKIIISESVLENGTDWDGKKMVSHPDEREREREREREGVPLAAHAQVLTFMLKAHIVTGDPRVPEHV